MGELGAIDLSCLHKFEISRLAPSGISGSSADLHSSLLLDLLDIEETLPVELHFYWKKLWSDPSMPTLKLWLACLLGNSDSFCMG